ncbi:DNA repair protein RadD [uncultured Gammaproteobacteria bacterium]
MSGKVTRKFAVSMASVWFGPTIPMGADMTTDQLVPDTAGFPVSVLGVRAHTRTHTCKGDAENPAVSGPEPTARTLRPYQNKAIADILAKLRRYRLVLLQLPTGAGKTCIAATVVKKLVTHGKRVVFLVHRVELLEQTSRTFSDEGIDHGVLRAGGPTPDVPVLIAMTQTIVRRLDQVPVPELLFIDEAHHATAGTWAAILAAWPSAYVIGLTATPTRLDGRGLGDVFDAMVQGPTVEELIRDGYLSRYRAFCPGTVDMSRVATLAGDYERCGAAEAIDRPAITGGIVEHYQRLAPGRQAILFAASIAHSKSLAAAFHAAGVPAVHLDGTTDKSWREAMVADFARGKVQVLCNVELFGEGFDVPDAEVAILARPTQSLALHLQQIGRVLRPSPGKDHALILDHVGNIARLGLPDDPREWSLDSKPKKEATKTPPAVRQCPVCSCAHRPAPTCPECGHTYAIKIRILDQRTGILIEVKREVPVELAPAWPTPWPPPGINIVTARGHHWLQMLKAAGGDKSRLQQIATERGFKPGWVYHQIRTFQQATGATQ